MKIALIGEKEIFNFFMPFGIKIYEATSRDDILSYIFEIKKTDYKILLLSNYSASLIEKDLESIYVNRDSLNIFILPPIKKEDKNSLYKTYLRHIVEKAVGIDLLSK